jgi:hypothetical protein
MTALSMIVITGAGVAAGVLNTASGGGTLGLGATFVRLPEGWRRWLVATWLFSAAHLEQLRSFPGTPPARHAARA